MKTRGSVRRHFTLGDWADFARKVAPQDEIAAMQAHLENCRKCQKEAQMMTRINEVAKRGGPIEPPDTALRSVRGVFAIHGPKRRRTARALVAELIFDSFRSPLQAGVRSLETDSRQLLFGAGDYRVDLRFEPRQDTDKVALVGQVLNASDPAQRLNSTPVALLLGRKVLAEARTNQFGEFHLECELKRQFRLCFTLPGYQQICIPLIDPTRYGSRELLQVIGMSGVSDTQKKNKSTRKDE